VEEAEDSVLTEGRLAVVNDAEVPTARRGVVDRHTLSHQAAARLGFGWATIRKGVKGRRQALRSWLVGVWTRIRLEILKI